MGMMQSSSIDPNNFVIWLYEQTAFKSRHHNNSNYDTFIGLLPSSPVNYFHRSAWMVDYLHAKSIEMWNENKTQFAWVSSDSGILTLYTATDAHKCEMFYSLDGNSLIYSRAKDIDSTHTAQSTHDSDR